MSRIRHGAEFWSEAWNRDLRDSVTLRVFGRVLGFGAWAALITVIDLLARPSMGIEVGPHEVAGAALGLLLVLRTNAAYERWWEARKLWGSIVNQSRNLVIGALAYGPNDRAWRESIVNWTCALVCVMRDSLRDDFTTPELEDLLGPQEAARLTAAEHRSTLAAYEIGRLLRHARDSGSLEGFAFLAIEQQRAILIDDIGACERIKKTPLAKVYSIKIRQFIVLYLATFPFAMIHTLRLEWLVPIVTMLIAYPILAIDQIGYEIQNPFRPRHLGALQLADITRTIIGNLKGLLAETEK